MKTPRPAWRLFLPMMLVVVAITILIGCIPISSPEKDVSGRDFRPLIDPHSNGPHLQAGIRRSQVESWLGVGSLERNELGSPEKNGRVVAYQMESIDGFYVVPLCFKTQDRRRIRELRVEYDEHDVVRAWSMRDWYVDVNPVGLLPGE